MSHTSDKKRKSWRIGIAIVIALIIVSFIISNKDKKIDPASFAGVEVMEPARHVKGNAESGLTLIEYSDFQCPACKAAEPDISALVDQFGDRFELEYRHFPLRSIHPNAQIGAQAAEAAGLQGKFWEMHDILFEKQDEWSQSFNPQRYLEEYAIEIGINADRFMFDLESDLIKGIVNSHFDEAMALKLPGTPAFVFNGEQVDINAFVNENLIVSEEIETVEE